MAQALAESFLREKTRVVRPRRVIHEQRFDEPERRQCSESFSAGGEGIEKTISQWIPERPEATPVEPMVSPPCPWESVAPPGSLERSRLCLICDVHLTGAKLVEMEKMVEQMICDRGPSRDEKAQYVLRRLPHCGLRTGTFCNNSQPYQRR